MDNERPIEKLLRRYGKQRSQEAGPPPELHPATRRLLQGEVARQYREERADQSASAKAPVHWWPRLVYALSVLAVVAVMAALLLPALSGAKSRSARVMSLSNLRQIDLAAKRYAEQNNDRLPASLDELTNELRARDVTVDPVTGKPYVYVAGGLPLKSLSTNSVLAYSLPSDGRNSVLLADGKVRQMTQVEFNRVSDEGLVRYAAPPSVAAVAPSASPTSAEALTRAKGAEQIEPTSGRATTESSREMARADKAVSLPVGETGVVTETPSAAPVPTMARAKPPPTTALAQSKVGEERTEVALAPAKASATAPTTLAAPVQSKVANENMPAVTANYADKAGASANVSKAGAVEFVNNEPLRSGGGGSAGNASMQKIVQNQIASFKNSSKVPVNTDVLDTFTVQQNGNDLVVVDSDGSTYAGNFVTVAGQAAQKEEAARRGTTDQAQVRQPVTAKAVSQPAELDSFGQNNYFSVAGTNKTLKQRVVFTGNIVAATNEEQLRMFESQVAAQAQMPAQQQALPLQWQLQNSMIVGKAQLGRNSQIEINAVPQKQ